MCYFYCIERSSEANLPIRQKDLRPDFDGLTTCLQFVRFALQICLLTMTPPPLPVQLDDQYESRYPPLPIDWTYRPGLELATYLRLEPNYSQVMAA